MTNNGSVSEDSHPYSASSLLAKALDIPSLNHHNRKGGGSRSSTSSSSESPTAVTPQDLEDDAMGDDCDQGTIHNHNNDTASDYETPESALQRSSPPTSHVRSMSSFDTPVTKNNKNFVASQKKTNTTSNNHSRPPMSPQSSFQSVGESSGTRSLGTHNSGLIGANEGPRHSDFTIPISNIPASPTTGSKEPPTAIRSTKVRRNVLGNSVGEKYHCSERDRNGRRPMIPLPSNYGSIPPPVAVVTTPTPLTAMTPLSSESTSMQQQQRRQAESSPHEHSEEWEAPPTTAQHTRSSSRMIPRVLPAKQYPDYDYYDEIVDEQHAKNRQSDTELQDLLPKTSYHHRREFRKSVHAQSLLVGLAFMVVWLPNNAMAPNLTQMADFYGMNDSERDLYLGSYCALALGVFCLPLSGGIGFMADFYSRKHLFLACCGLGALSAAWSGWAPNYWHLFFARLCSGGCMSGSVPVAFSLLGDLFSKEERNAASSGLTSMMGLGILLGQIYAGMVGPSHSWQYPFFVSAGVQLAMAIVIALWVEEPDRGATEKALQGIFKSGNKYEKRLTMQGFIDTMRKNASNWILLWQGFLTSLPWGIVFVFLNDYLSQEKGFSVQEATFLVMLFGVGCAFGGITGGYLGQLFMRGNRSYLPLFMSAATFLGIIPFMALLNSNFPNHNGIRSKFYSVMGGCIASLPSVNIRPCIINVNPPESRGAALTAANLFVSLGRGMGPSCITLLGSIFHASRQASFNITLSFFWTISAIQLAFLAKTLPRDQDAMEEELLRYAAAAHGGVDSDSCDEEDPAGSGGDHPKSPVRTTVTARETDALQPKTPDRLDSAREVLDDKLLYESIISSPPGQYMAIDGKSARESLEFVMHGIQEFGDEINLRNAHCRGCETISPCESQDDVRPSGERNEIAANGGEVLFSQEDEISQQEMERRREMWMRRQQQQRETD